MPFEFAQIVAELIESVFLGGDLEGGDDRFVDLFGGPAAGGAAVMEQHFEKTDDTCVMDFDARVTDRPNGDGQGDSLQQREVHVDVEALRLEARETVRDGPKLPADRIEVIESLFQTEVAQVIGTEFVAKETGELLVLLKERMLPVSPENVMPVFDLIDHRRELPLQPLIQPDAEDLTDAIRRASS